jgi:hypothetical protein
MYRLFAALQTSVSVEKLRMIANELEQVFKKNPLKKA